MARPRAAIILAAGKSTRMKSRQSKVAHDLAGRPLLGWVHALAEAQGCERIVCVVSEGDVRGMAEGMGMTIALQDPQEGTGHAVLCAEGAMEGFDGDVVVLYGDTPLVREATIGSVFDALGGTDIAVLGFRAEEPGSYGRLIEEDGELQAIVEAKEASPEELAVELCNSGVMAADWKRMLGALRKVTNSNAKGEYYLTDLVEIIRADGGSAKAVHGSEAEMLGVNSREDLAAAHGAFQAVQREYFLGKGVTLRDPGSVVFSYDTAIERDATVCENVVFGPGVHVGAEAVIHPFCHIEGASIGEGAQVGPFARLRPGTDLGENTKVGNFVEVKKAVVGEGSKINHLSYIGDAELGEGVNVGAGVITCNYDGYQKHKTTVADGAFVGSNSSLVAPVTVGEGAYVGSGSTVTDDVPAGALALARGKQTNKDGWAARFHAAMRKRLGRKGDGV